MRICTFNVNSIKARKDLLMDWLDHRDNDIDVLCLQELKLMEEFFPFDYFQKKGFACEAFGQKAYNGVAICSRYPIQSVHKGFGDPTWDEQKRFISTTISDIHIINLYAPHGDIRGEDKFFYKQKWYKHLISHLSHNYSPENPILIVGDLNVARSDEDVYSPETRRDTIGTMPEERESLRNLLDWGFIDVYRYLHPTQQQFTWWGYMGGAIWKNDGMRIDYVLATKPLMETFKSIEIDLWPRKRRTPTPSDHAPLLAVIDIS